MTSIPDIAWRRRPVRRWALIAIAGTLGFAAIGLAGAVPRSAVARDLPPPRATAAVAVLPYLLPGSSNVFVLRPTSPDMTPQLAPSVRVSERALAEAAYSAMVRRIARRYSVEWKLVMAIIASESGGDAAAVSPAGAVGLMQLMPETASDLGVDPYNPEQNVEGAVRYLSSLLSTFGSVDLTLVAYNAGPGFAMRYRDGAVELGAETRAFLTRVGEFLN
jgi:soluble lytic murein transglycosylase-like protein